MEMYFFISYYHFIGVRFLWINTSLRQLQILQNYSETLVCNITENNTVQFIPKQDEIVND